MYSIDHRSFLSDVDRMFENNFIDSTEEAAGHFYQSQNLDEEQKTNSDRNRLIGKNINLEDDQYVSFKAGIKQEENIAEDDNFFNF